MAGSLVSCLLLCLLPELQQRDCVRPCIIVPSTHAYHKTTSLTASDKPTRSCVAQQQGFQNLCSCSALHKQSAYLPLTPALQPAASGGHIWKHSPACLIGETCMGQLQNEPIQYMSAGITSSQGDSWAEGPHPCWRWRCGHYGHPDCQGMGGVRCHHLLSWQVCLCKGTGSPCTTADLWPSLLRCPNLSGIDCLLTPLLSAQQQRSMRLLRNDDASVLHFLHQSGLVEQHWVATGCF